MTDTQGKYVDYEKSKPDIHEFIKLHNLDLTNCQGPTVQFQKFQ